MSFNWSGDKELRELFRHIQNNSSQAAASALTGLAYDVRQEVKNDIPKWVRLTRQFLPNSVAYEKATPANLTATVGFDKRADFANLLEEGGTRKPINSRTIAVPTEEIRRTSKGGISNANRPKQVLQKNGAFSGAPENHPQARSGIWQATQRIPLRILYVYKDSTRYNKKFLRFRETAQQVIDRNTEQRFAKELARLISKR